MASTTSSCIKCSKQFLIIDQEQSFLQKKGLPNPSMCPQCRQTRRLLLRGGRQLFKATCQRCSRQIITSFDPNKVKNPIFCKEDYDRWFNENDPMISDPLPS